MTPNATGDLAVWAFAEHEHRDLARGIERIHAVACEVGERPTPELSAHVLEVLDWVGGSLAPHIAWEEGWLFPEIEARTGNPWATRAARFDHQQIREMSGRLRADHARLLGTYEGDRKAETRCHLFSLEALVRSHIEWEERFLIPLLDQDRADRGPTPPATPSRAAD